MRVVAIRRWSLLILAALIATGTLSARPGLTYAQSPTPATAPPIGNGETSLFPVEKDGKWGYIDPSGRIVIRPQFDYADRFSDGVAAVTLDDDESHRGYVDETGKIVAIPKHPSRFGRRTEFHEGLALVDVLNPNRAHDGRSVLSGFIDKTGQLRIPPIYAVADDFSGGLACVRYNTSYYDKASYVFIDKDGKVGIPSRYESAQSFSEGLAAVKIDAKWGFIDAKGAMVISPRYDDVQRFSEGLAGARVGDQWGFIDKAGSMVIAPQFDEVNIFSDGRAAARFGLGSRSWGFIDKAGSVVIKPNFYAVLPFSDGRALVSRVGFSDVQPRIERNAKVGFIDSTGKLVIPYQFEYARPFAHGRAEVQIKDNSGLLMGYIDTSGKYIWQPTPCCRAPWLM